MQPSPLELNAGSAFDAGDVNNDGYIDLEDMCLAGLQVADRLGLPARSPARDRLGDAYAQVWESLATSIGTDEHGRISRLSYIEYAVSPWLDKTSFIVAVVWPVIDALWAALDADGDGELGLDEYLHLWSAYGRATSEAREAFILLDTDGDGHLGKDEFAQAIYDSYFSATPGRPATPCAAAGEDPAGAPA